MRGEGKLADYGTPAVAWKSLASSPEKVFPNSGGGLAKVFSEIGGKVRGMSRRLCEARPITMPQRRRYPGQNKSRLELWEERLKYLVAALVKA